VGRVYWKYYNEQLNAEAQKQGEDAVFPSAICRAAKSSAKQSEATQTSEENGFLFVLHYPNLCFAVLRYVL
jgi:hypothetical protein